MRLKEFFQKKEWKKWDKTQWTIMILTGVLLMIVALPAERQKIKEDSEIESVAQTEYTDVKYEDYAKKLEEKLEDTLGEIQGAGKVKTMITLEDSGESIVEKDDSRETSNLQETDSAGGTRQETDLQTSKTTVYREADNEKVPFIGRERTPKIAGILVVAEGGENTAVKQNISEAVMALFQIDVNRIKVVKMNVQEEEH